MSDASPTALAGAVSACVMALCRVVCSAGQGIWRGRHPAIAPLAPLILARLDRLSRRFRGLVERHAAGTLQPPKPRTRQPADAAPDAPRRPPDPLPRGDAWLLRLLMRPETEQARMDLVAYTNTLLAEIAGPAMQRLIAEAPTQTGRLLRPLLRMTRGEAEIPACLRLPPRPKRRRPQRPRGNPSPRPRLGEEVAPAPPSPPDPPPTLPAPRQKPLWRVVPVIRVVWRKPNTIRIRAGPRFSRD